MLKKKGFLGLTSGPDPNPHEPGKALQLLEALEVTADLYHRTGNGVILNHRRPHAFTKY